METLQILQPYLIELSNILILVSSTLKIFNLIINNQITLANTEVAYIDISVSHNYISVA